MSPDIPPAPPEAEVIKLARKATGMTALTAATEAGISPTYWRDVERGHGGRRGRQVAVRASDRMLAAMARVTGVSPDQLAEAGREDAALVLEEIQRRDLPPLAAVPDLPDAAGGPGHDEGPFVHELMMSGGVRTEREQMVWQSPFSAEQRARTILEMRAALAAARPAGVPRQRRHGTG